MKRRSFWLGLGLFVTALLAGVLFFIFQSKQDSQTLVQPEARVEQPAGALPVRVYVVEEAPFDVSIPATGTLLARESVELVSELSRRLVRVHAREGERVKKGAVLFELDAADLRAELTRLNVQYELAKKHAERQRRLLSEQVTTEAESEAAQAQLEELQAARQVLQVTLDKTKIRAPFDGVLGLRRVSEGAWVSPSTVLVSLQDTSQLKIDFLVPERYTSLLKEKGEFLLSVEGQAGELRGNILAVEPNVETSSRSLLVRGLIENGAQLLPGTFAKVQLPLTLEKALAIPSIAVIPGVEGRSVFVERAGHVQSVQVELGARSAQQVQVLSGLQVGDRVIVSHLLRLRAGQAVSVEQEAP